MVEVQEADKKLFLCKVIDLYFIAMEFAGFRTKYLTTKRCIIDLLHFFIGWAFLSINQPKKFVELFGNEATVAHSHNSTNNTTATIYCSEKEPMETVNSILSIIILVSMVLNFVILMQHMFSQNVAKFEPKFFLSVAGVFSVILIAVILVHIIFVCFPVNFFINIILLTLEAILYFSQFCITKKKLLLQNRRIDSRCTPSTPPPEYNNIMRLQSPLSRCLPNENDNLRAAPVAPYPDDDSNDSAN